MNYILPIPNPSGAYSPPQSTCIPGLVEFPDEFLPDFLSHGGFVNLEHDGTTVTSMTPNVEAWEAWKASLPPPAPPEPAPPTNAELAAENKLLRQQVTALTGQNEFQEELIVELATVVYA